MGLEGAIAQISGMRQAQVSSEMQVKLQKGAMEQEGKVIMQLIESAVAVPVQSPPDGRGRLIDVVA